MSLFFIPIISFTRLLLYPSTLLTPSSIFRMSSPSLWSLMTGASVCHAVMIISDGKEKNTIVDKVLTYKYTYSTQFQWQLSPFPTVILDNYYSLIVCTLQSYDEIVKVGRSATFMIVKRNLLKMMVWRGNSMLKRAWWGGSAMLLWEMARQVRNWEANLGIIFFIYLFFLKPIAPVGYSLEEP